MGALITQCCIAGGGPAGLMLGYLLARAGVDVTVLEKHADFLRDFRGDTVHPSTLEVMVELGIIDRFLKLPHQKVFKVGGLVGETPVTIADFSHLPVRERYIAMMPQWDFLNFLAEEASPYAGFRLLMRTEATDLMTDGDRVVGVKASAPEGPKEIRADLVVAADGRNSVLRTRAGLEVEDFGAPMDVLWFRLPAEPGDEGETMGRFGAASLFVLIFRGDYWQCAYVIPKGAFGGIKARGLEAFRDVIATVGPFSRSRLNALASWEDVSLLTVRVDRLRQWYRPGLLFIGDAAHAMSPIGGVGVNLAVQDAVAAANRLAEPLKTGTATIDDLKAVQRRRAFPTRVTQAIQLQMQTMIIGPTLKLTEQPKPPFAVRLMQRFPVLQRLPARVLGLGVRREHVAEFIREGRG
ncbi:FAD-dependent oxidoreductase [Hyphomicrobium sp. CS1GBMeth3]|uniref:FAD-dependent oxidoreductase n=1 Tax=Hyphomicrobium sp. CS1GBMeth3 TaxID=1892845 RepID=UPI000931EF5F|nr:FAD-dependent oxidoreductase [Hyphomicrobium sp. CS1GBMeth3]